MLKYLLNLFYPKICLGCQKQLLLSENQICTNCRHEIPLTNHFLTKNNEAFKKFYGKLPVEDVICFMYYHKKGIVQNLIHNLKYNGHQELGELIGDWASLNLNEKNIFSNCDYIIPVPLHKKRLKERGYNQVNTFSESISKHLNIPISNEILVRNHYTESQSKKNLATRNLNIDNIFDCIVTDDLSGKHFLLIDDVLTTGATLEACGKALLKIPNAKISILTMAFSES